MTPKDTQFMSLALRLGRRGLGRTSPNPPVGAVVLRNGRIVGRGYHRRAGLPHAEVEALRDAGAAARGATLYVTLEPCAHHGRTPPCTDAIRAAGVRRVVIGCADPNPRVRGGGAGLLRRAGIDVEIGVRRAEAEELISAFRKSVTTGLPWVTLKLAASLDGRIATAGGDSRWVTGEAARRLAHQLRNTHDALLVGCETVIHDDPALTCRLRGGRDPLRLVLDGRLRLPLAARIVSSAAASGTVIITQRPAKRTAARTLRLRGAEVMELPARRRGISLTTALKTLVRTRGISSVLIEGGGLVAATALRDQLVDRLLLFYAPALVGGDGRPMIGPLNLSRMADSLKLRIRRSRWIGPDLVIEADLAQANRPTPCPNPPHTP